MWNSVLGFFQLILVVSLDFTPVIIYKRSGVAKIFTEKSFKFWLKYEDYPFVLVMVLVLCLLEADSPTKKRDGKWDMVRTCGPNSVKVILTLLTKVVIVHMRFPKIQVRKSSLDRSFSGLSISWSRVLNGLYEGFHKLFEQLFGGD